MYYQIVQDKKQKKKNIKAQRLKERVGSHSAKKHRTGSEGTPEMFLYFSGIPANLKLYQKTLF